MEKTNTNTNYSAIILAGGNSSRMNYPKPWLKLNNGTTFLSSIINSFKKNQVNNIIVVLNKNIITSKWENEINEIREIATIIPNEFPDKGRLYSLSLGLKKVKSKFVFVHNVDSPFIENDVFHKLITNSHLNDVIIPSYREKGGHPVLINSKVQQEIEKNYTRYSTLKDVFNNFSKAYIEVNSKTILTNINTPQELAETI